MNIMQFQISPRGRKLQKVARTKFLGSERLIFCFISISKFDSLKNLFTTITSLPELQFRCRIFSLLVQTE